jgi:anti-sigma B factor antagonist
MVETTPESIRVPAGGLHGEVWRPHRGAVVVTVHGAVEVTTAEQFGGLLAAPLAEHPLVLIVDLSQVEFLATAGLSVLVGLDEQARERGVRLGVVADPRREVITRALTAAGLERRLALSPTVDAACVQHLPDNPSEDRRHDNTRR